MSKVLTGCENFPMCEPRFAAEPRIQAPPPPPEAPQRQRLPGGGNGQFKGAFAWFAGEEAETQHRAAVLPGAHPGPGLRRHLPREACPDRLGSVGSPLMLPAPRLALFFPCLLPPRDLCVGFHCRHPTESSLSKAGVLSILCTDCTFSTTDSACVRRRSAFTY